MSYDDWNIQTEDDGLDYERAYDAAVKRHAKAQWQEYRDTGEQLDPLPAFGEEAEVGMAYGHDYAKANPTYTGPCPMCQLKVQP